MPEDRTQKTKHGRQKQEARSKKSVLCSLSSVLLFLVSCFFLLSTFAQAEERKDVQKIDRLVILPMVNISGNFDAQTIIDSLLQKGLKKRGFKLVPYEDVDKFLSNRRIRNTSSIDRITTLELNRELGVDAVILGSIDQYSNIRDEIYVGLTLRLIGTRDCSIMWMDSVSYTGSDFVGLLGIGRVSSLDKLGEVAVNNIVDGIPRKYLFGNREDNLLEMGNLKISPAFVGGGKSAKVSVKIVSVAEKPVQVQAYVGEMKFDLKNGNGNYYDGEITVPFIDGLYAVDIIATLSDGKAFHFPSAGVVNVNTVPPKVTISTNKDFTAGFIKKDSIIFTLKSDKAIEKWEVEIVDKENKYVRGGRGFGTLPMQLVWSGENDAGGRNNDGVYNLKLSVWDASGNAGFFQKEIMLDTTPPKVKINAETSDSEGVVFNIDYEKEEIIDKWEFIVTGENSEIIKKISGRGDIDKRIAVSLMLGERALGSRKLMYTFKAIDKAGNIFETSNQTNIFAEKKEEKFAKKNEKFINSWGEGDF
ncbi:MAG: hypothetical protein HY096_13985 [Nitrospinae bacterium]|nr:hypothetical protein [Nitrospinota bacterium]